MTAIPEPGLPRFVLSPAAALPYSPTPGRHLLRGLNREQRRAVTHDRGPVIVIAGPGSGKTEVVTRRVAWLIATRRARPREILALTFTDNAAQEMQARVDMLVPYGQADAAIHTFHAFGDRLLREHSFELGLPSDVRLVGPRELIVLLRDHLFELGLQRYLPLGDPARFLAALLELFSRAKDEDISPVALAEHAAALATGTPDEVISDLAAGRAELALAYQRYCDLLARRGLIDHSDQVALALRLLREHPAIRRSLGARYRYVLVDELQDTNRAQLELVLALGNMEQNLFAVGDPGQGIYGFRGARAGNVDSFARAFADTREIRLRRNYRSLQPIIDASGRVLATSRMAAWQSPQVPHRRARGTAVRHVSHATAEAEWDAVGTEIAGRLVRGARAGDFAVLVRSNGEVDDVVRSLLARGVPADGGTRNALADLPGVRTLIAYLRVVSNPHDNLELFALAGGWPYEMSGETLGILLSGARRRNRTLWDALETVVDAGDGRLDRAAVQVVTKLVNDVRRGVDHSAQMTSGALLYDYLGRSGWLRRLAAADDEDGVVEARGVAQLCSLVRRQATLLAHDRVQFLAPLLDVTEPDADAEASADLDAVRVMTVHRAKGLEFKVVFICGLVDGHFPVHARPATLALPDELSSTGEQDPDNFLEEERRLFYVALTRARDEVVLTSHRTGHRGRGRRRPSVFVAEALGLSAELLTPSEAEPGADLGAILLAPQARPEPAQSADTSLVLSYSQVDDYLTCPERYRLRYAIGLPTPPHHLLSYGTAIHQSLAAFHAAQARGVTLSDDELAGELARAWQPDGFLTREHEEARFAAGKVALSRFRAQQIAAGAEPPTAVERPFVFRLGQDEIRGRIDRIDGGGADAVITDYKSSDVRDQQRANVKARESLQLQVYALAYEAETGSLPSTVQLHFVESGVIGSATPDAKRLDKARLQLISVADAIRSKKFKPRPSPIGCGYCPYRAMCSASAARDT